MSFPLKFPVAVFLLILWVNIIDMVQTRNSTESSVQQTGMQSKTEPIQDEFISRMMNAVDEEYNTMLELNIMLEKLETESSVTEINEMAKIQKKFQESFTEIKTEYFRQTDWYKTKQLQEHAELEAELKMVTGKLGMKTTEINSFKTSIKNLEEKLHKKDIEINELKESNVNLKKEEKRTREDYKEAFTKQIQAQKECGYLTAEIEIIKKTVQAEKRELDEMWSSITFAQNTFEKANKLDFKQKLENIKTEYDENLNKVKTEMEMSYTYQEIKHENEISKIKEAHENQIIKHNRAFQALKTHLDELKNTIIRYKILLETKTGVAELEEITNVTKEHTVAAELEEHTVTKSEKSNKVEIKTTSESHKVSYNSSESDQMPKPLTIKEFDAAGNFLVIHNSDKNEIDISNWMIERTFPKGEKTQFKIPKGIKISAEKDLKILSKSASDKKAPGDIIATFQTWGTGKGEIKVKDTNGKEIILHHIK